MAYDFDHLRVNIDEKVAFATIDNPPINLMSLPLFMDLLRFGNEVAADESVLMWYAAVPCWVACSMAGVMAVSPPAAASPWERAPKLALVG